MDINYLAGLFDGEGSISIIKNNAKGNRKVRYQLLVQLGNTDSRLPYLFRMKFKGRVGKESMHTKHKLWRWTVYGDKAVNALRQMLPYLITKKAQAAWGILYRTDPNRKQLAEEYRQRIKEEKLWLLTS